MTVSTALAVCMDSLANAAAALSTLPAPLLRAGFSAMAIDIEASSLKIANWPDEVDSTVLLAELVLAPAQELQMTTTEGLSVRLNGGASRQYPARPSHT